MVFHHNPYIVAQTLPHILIVLNQHLDKKEIRKKERKEKKRKEKINDTQHLLQELWVHKNKYYLFGPLILPTNRWEQILEDIHIS